MTILSHLLWKNPFSLPAKGTGRRRRRSFAWLALFLSGSLLLVHVDAVRCYPLDGFQETGIRRLLRLQRLAEANDLWTLEKGARLESGAIRLQL